MQTVRGQIIFESYCSVLAEMTESLVTASHHAFPSRDIASLETMNMDIYHNQTAFVVRMDNHQVNARRRDSILRDHAS